MLLYAKTDESIAPDDAFKITGNWYYVKTLDLSGNFDLVRNTLDSIKDMWLMSST